MGKRWKVMLVVLGFLFSIVISSFAQESIHNSANNTKKDITVDTSQYKKSKGRTHRKHGARNKTKHTIKENRR